jgi:phage terminase large subunit-like protein
MAYDPSNAKLLAEEITAGGFQAVSMAQKAYMFNEPIREFLHLLKIHNIIHIHIFPHQLSGKNNMPTNH